MATTKTEYRAYLSEKNIRLVSFDFKSSVHECRVCGKVWNARPNNVLRRQSGCKQCYLRASHELKRLESNKSYLALCKKRKVKLLEPYQTMLVKVKHVCLVCNTEWCVKPNDVANAKSGNRCPMCALQKASVRMRMSEKEMRSRIEENGRVKVLEIFARGKCKKPECTVACLKCGFEFKATAYDLIYSASGCSGPCKVAASAKGMIKFKPYVLGKDEIYIQGYEGLALDWLQETAKIKPKDIRAGSKRADIPVIEYWFKGKTRKYFPDIYVPRMKRLVEIKSTYTVGLKMPLWFRKNREKARACKEHGYDFKLLVFSAKGSLLKMPKGWTDLTYKKFCREFHRLNGNVN